MSQDAINASAQNVVVAINSLSKFIDLISATLVTSSATLIDIDRKQFGTTNSSPVAQTAISPAALNQTSVIDGVGYIVKLSVIVPGTSSGIIYDQVSTSAGTSAEYLAAIPNTIGVFELHLRYSLGIIVAPGYGQTVLISYSPD